MSRFTPSASPTSISGEATAFGSINNDANPDDDEWDSEFDNVPLTGEPVEIATSSSTTAGGTFGRFMNRVRDHLSAPKFRRLHNDVDADAGGGSGDNSDVVDHPRSRGIGVPSDSEEWDNLSCWHKCARMNKAVFCISLLLAVVLFLAVAFGGSHHPSPTALPPYCDYWRSKRVSEMARRVLRRSPIGGAENLIYNVVLCVVGDEYKNKSLEIRRAAGWKDDQTTDKNKNKKDDADYYGPRVRPQEDAFELWASHGIVTIVGTTGSAASHGFYWYLKNALGCQVTWGADQLSTLPQDPGTPLPDWPRTAVKASAPWRHAWNMCTFGYTSTWWNWDRWEREIDWMALHGVNFPLALVGQEYVWIHAFAQYGINPAEMEAWFTGPAFLPWQRAGNVMGWGGPLPMQWIIDQRDLQRKILARMRELGMTPILPCFAGHVPAAARRVWPHAKFTEPKEPWNRMPVQYGDVLLVDPTEPAFANISAAFMTALDQTYGLSGYYSCDTFNENPPPTEYQPRDWEVEYLHNASRAVVDGITATDPNGTWVMQGWLFSGGHFPFWAENKYRVEAYVHGAPADRLIILDLHAEDGSLALYYDDFYGRASIWCTLHNYGGVRGMYGALNHYATQPFKDMIASPKRSVVGIGFTPEAIEQNPIVYELVTETFFGVPEFIDGSQQQQQTTAPRLGVAFTRTVFPAAYHLFDISDWVRRYIVQRYAQGLSVTAKKNLAAMRRNGKATSSSTSSNSNNNNSSKLLFSLETDMHHLNNAWRILLDVFYSQPDEPKTELEKVPVVQNQPPLGERRHGTPQAMFHSLLHVLEAIAVGEADPESSAPLHYDMVDIARQTGTMFFTDVHIMWLNAARSLSDPAAIAKFRRVTAYLVDLILILDDVLGTDENYMLGKWLGDAVANAKDDTSPNRTAIEQLFRFNAKNQITMWGPGGQDTTDYARKGWSGLYSTYYKMRWLNAAQYLESVQGCNGVDLGAFNDEMLAAEQQWNYNTTDQDTVPKAPFTSFTLNDSAVKLVSHISLSVEELAQQYTRYEHVGDVDYWESYSSFSMQPVWGREPRQLARLCELAEGECLGFTSGGYLLTRAPDLPANREKKQGAPDVYLRK